MSKLKLTALKGLILFILWPSLALSQPGGDQPDTGPFLAPRDRAALHLTGLIPLTSAKKAKTWLQECPSSSTLAPAAKQSFCEHFLEIQRVRPRPTHQRFWNPQTQLIMFGERHTEAENRIFLGQRLELLSRDGFNTLALEMFNSNAQEKLDQFLEGRLSNQDLKKLLQKHWNYPSESYMKLIRKARQLGMKILALDNRALKKGDFSRDLIRRDQHMANILNAYFKENPESKVVSLTGRLHAYKSFSKTKRPETIIEMLQNKMNSLKAESFLMLASIEKTAFTVLMEELIPNHRRKLIASQSFLPYTDGLIHLGSLNSTLEF